MAQDRIWSNTTENVIANMKIKSSMSYKKKNSFPMIHIPLWSENKNLIKHWSESPPAGQKRFCIWKTSNMTEVRQEHFTTHTKLLKKTFPQPLAQWHKYKAVVFPKYDLLYKALHMIWLTLSMGQKENPRSWILFRFLITLSLDSSLSFWKYITHYTLQIYIIYGLYKVEFDLQWEGQLLNSFFC